MLTENEKKFLSAKSEVYSTRESVISKILKLSGELYLPKGTEHFLSDIHGEYEAFSHIRRSASGVIRRKIDRLFSSLDEGERAELASLVYYPEYKAERVRDEESAIKRLASVLREVCRKYDSEKVQRVLSHGDYGDIIYSLLTPTDRSDTVIMRAVRLGEGKKIISELSRAIRALAVDRLHIVGDIFDRGARPDKILDELITLEKIDIAWGNHDVLWIGAAAGSEACILGSLFNSLSYRNIDFIEIGYGISLRPLAAFAEEIYGGSELSSFYPKGDKEGVNILGDGDRLIAAMRKAVAVMMWKSEGEIIKRNPSYGMEERLLLDKISDGSILIDGKYYHLADSDFPTVDKGAPYVLTQREKELCDYLTLAYKSSEKLQRHIRFLLKAGGMYKICNRNLIFHGAIPLDEKGDLLPLGAVGGRSGRALMDFCDSAVRDGYFSGNERALDLIWFLWCGRNSPLSGREKITTFERLLIDDEEIWKEPRNPYYEVWRSSALAEKILLEFGLSGVRSHIINGHIPVKKGESPIKADGRLILIDGGFCHAFLGRTGIAGYTLIYNSEGMRISAHAPFAGLSEAVSRNADIVHDTAVFETSKEEIKVINTDEGKMILEEITDLMSLLNAYESGEIGEKQFF